MRIALVVLGLLALGTATAEPSVNRIDANVAITAAIREVATRGRLECEEAENWSVAGAPELAADFVESELDQRGWPVIDHGPLTLSYVVIADPDPNNERAIAIAGMVFERGEDESYVFLERCLTE